jgi:hypothetical protein
MVSSPSGTTPLKGSVRRLSGLGGDGSDSGVDRFLRYLAEQSPIPCVGEMDTDTDKENRNNIHVNMRDKESREKINFIEKEGMCSLLIHFCLFLISSPCLFLSGSCTF